MFCGDGGIYKGFWVLREESFFFMNGLERRRYFIRFRVGFDFYWMNDFGKII